jgi:hypothetical protein
LEEHPWLGDHAGPGVEDIGDPHLGRPVEDDAQCAVLVGVEQQDDCLGEVR